MSIMDTAIPSVRRLNKSMFEIGEEIIPEEKFESAVGHLRGNVTDAPDNNLLEEYLAENPSNSEAFQDLLRRTLLVFLKEDSRKGLKVVMSALK